MKGKRRETLERVRTDRTTEKNKPEVRQMVAHLAAEDKDRMHWLAGQNKERKLSEEEESELDNFCRVGRLLSILKSKARKVLRQDPHS
jgi:hypothetical protein